MKMPASDQAKGRRLGILRIKDDRHRRAHVCQASNSLVICRGANGPGLYHPAGECMMPKMLKMGAVGADVMVLQGAINLSPSVLPPLLATDGIFGAKTLAGVMAFQRANNLVVDGIAGPLTWEKLLAGRRPAKPASPICGCCEANHPDPLLREALTSFLKNNQNMRQAFSAPQAGSASIGLPSLPSVPKLRRLTTAEQTLISGSYGTSIDFSTVMLSDKTGLGGRAFVVAVPSPFGIGAAQQVVNIGPSFTTHTLIHEMGHVWQSQHHASPTQYMVNAVASQAAAEAANLAMKVSTYSAYGYVPGRPFSEYGAEQLAQQVANGETPIVAHVKSIAKGAIDPDLSLKLPRFEDTAASGVKS
jgi:hypothetical protein